MTSALDNVTNWISVDEASELLGISSGKVRRLIEEHNLIAVKRDGELKMPAEIIVEGHPLPPLHGTMVVLLDAGLNYQESIEWLYTHNEALNGTPMALLLKGHKAPVRAQALIAL